MSTKSRSILSKNKALKSPKTPEFSGYKKVNKNKPKQYKKFKLVSELFIY